VKKYNLYVVDVKVERSVSLRAMEATRSTMAGSIGFMRRSLPTAPPRVPMNGRRRQAHRLPSARRWPCPDYPITNYLATHVSLIHERFPQPGDPNPLPSLHVVAVDDAAAKPPVITLDRKQVEYFGPTFTWTPDSAAICFLALNRAQTGVAVHRWSCRQGATACCSWSMTRIG